MDWDNQHQFEHVFTQDMVDKAINKLTYPRLGTISINKFNGVMDAKNISHNILYMWTDEYSWYAEIEIIDNVPAGKLLLELKNLGVEIKFSPVGMIDFEQYVYNFITVIPLYKI